MDMRRPGVKDVAETEKQTFEKPTAVMLACDHEWRECMALPDCEVCDECDWHTTIEGPKPV
jgi:hypothetical protein